MQARFVTRLPEPRFYTCKMRRCGMFQYGLKPGFRRAIHERPLSLSCEHLFKSWHDGVLKSYDRRYNSSNTHLPCSRKSSLFELHHGNQNATQNPPD